MRDTASVLDEYDTACQLVRWMRPTTVVHKNVRHVHAQIASTRSLAMH